MKFRQLFSILLLAFSFGLFLNCSSDDASTESNDNNPPVIDNTDNDEPVVVDAPVIDNSIDTANLLERFVFDQNIVIENSYNTPCTSIPCRTIDEELTDIFEGDFPDDNYFSLAEDGSVLNLESQFQEGRRIEFKQDSEGPLTSFARLELEGVYQDINEDGITIAQVHNRGGTGNKPFFRLVLFEDKLETVIRRDPEVSSNQTSFSREEFSFVGGADYDQSSLRVVVEKSDGMVHISVEQAGQTILDRSYEPNPSTRWLTDNGIANGYYLKAGIYNDDSDHTKNLVVSFSTVVFESDDIDFI